jgi:hypothetical protein
MHLEALSELRDLDADNVVLAGLIAFPASEDADADVLLPQIVSLSVESLIAEK